MDELERSFRSWMTSRGIEGSSMEEPDENRVSFCAADLTAEVLFHRFDDEPTIVELRIVERGDDTPRFFLHFQLTSERRAHELFEEMAEAFAEIGAGSKVQILLSCTSGMTTALFAQRLADATQLLSLDYEFVALPLEEALSSRRRYSAVLIAPQIAFRRAEIARAFPEVPVIDIPARTFASLDAGSTLRMVMDALRDFYDVSVVRLDPSRIVRELDMERRVLVITAVSRSHSVRLGYRLYDHGSVTTGGVISKRHFDLRDIDDLLCTLEHEGTRISDLDAVGIAVPWMSEALARGDGDGSREPSFERLASERHDTKVFVDRSPNAAAVGCYISQDRYETIAFHVQPTGYFVGGQGSIVEGRLVRGRRGMAGELGGAASRMSLSRDRNDAVWSGDGMLEIVGNYLSFSVSVLAPEAVFVACDLVPDMGALRGELERHMPAERVPELIAVDDYRERVYLGELALCLNRLSTSTSSQGA